ncbi:hypothetical protein XF30_29220 [Bradyrhizobium sp. SUTN9-2]|nr:hypothetical protein XF30_29220 [Bradyrhizobium sp. SUTN9-2]
MYLIDRGGNMIGGRFRKQGGGETRGRSSCFVIASQRVRAKRGPMTGSAKQSRIAPGRQPGLLRRKGSSQ